MKFAILILLASVQLSLSDGVINLRWIVPPMPFPPPSIGAEIFGTGTNVAGNTDLNWILFRHSDVPRPVVLVVHIGEFKEGVPGPLAVCRDYYYAGYNCAAVQHRLADPGHEMRSSHGNQPVNDHGNYPEQTDDLSQAVIAARTGSTPFLTGWVTGKVAGVGGSAGGGHVATLAAGTLHGGDKLDCGVMLSGTFDLHDPSSQAPGCGTNFGNDVHNYVNCTAGDPACDGNGGLLDMASPYRRFGPTSSPVKFFRSSTDPMPAGQYSKLASTLTTVGAPFTNRIISDPAYNPANGCTRHAFQYLASCRSELAGQRFRRINRLCGKRNAFAMMIASKIIVALTVIAIVVLFVWWLLQGQ